jgi:hypothetical protein
MYQVHMVAVDTTNGDCKAVFGWYEVTGKNEPWEPLFTAPTVVTLIAKAKEELGTRFIREHGLDGVVPADTLRTGKVKPDSSDLFFSHLHK